MKKGLAIVALAGLAGLASAAPIQINESAVGGGTFVLNPGNLSPTVFSAPSPTFSNNALAYIHSELQGDGVNTNDIVTIIAGDTDDGLALFALIDEEVSGFKNFNARLDLVAVANDANNDGITGWVNDNGGELVQVANSNPIAGTYNFDTTFQWDTNGKGDAFALSDLGVGDNGSFVFNPIQGYGSFGVSRGFQYVSFDNGAWHVVGTGTFNGSLANPTSTSLDWRVIPLPHAGAMSLAGLGLIGVRRRRSM
ncbi:MAG: hypothetical protein H6809_03345 [Phycisphaeraceae bacterium]|nr:hypothetical protein [Phycisphaeraceae bacterium]